jgi:lambda family phage portal protein
MFGWLKKSSPRKRSKIVSNASWSKAQFLSAMHQGGAYHPLDKGRLVADPIRYASGTMNALLSMSVQELSDILRQLERNNATVRAAVEAYKARVVGTGITVRPDTGNDDWDKRISDRWNEIRSHLGADGESDMELQRIWCGDCVVSGACFGRFVAIEDRIDQGLPPLAVIPMELEWLCESTDRDIPAGHTFAHGIEYDRYGRRKYYHIKNPERSDARIERVPASQIIHGFERRRARQVIGEPVIVAIIERALQLGRLTDTEIQAAANALCLTTFTKSQYPPDTLDDDKDTDSDGEDRMITEFPIGAHVNLPEGEDAGAFKIERPNTNVPKFCHSLNKDMAAAAGVSIVDLDRDGSQYNFANSRFDQIRSNMNTKPFQRWFGPATIGRIYEEFLPYLTLAAGLSWPDERSTRMKHLRKYQLQPDIPPEHDVGGAAQAFTSLFEIGGATLEDWYSQKGEDWKRKIEQWKMEKQVLREMIQEESEQPAGEGNA